MNSAQRFYGFVSLHFMMERTSPNFCFLGSMDLVSALIFMYLFSCISPINGYDPLDPNGNITIKWDIMRWDDETYSVRVSIFNFQLFRHVEKPGWRLSFEWKGEEVIWGITGAEATEQGNCSRIKGSNLPHSCDKKPVIIDFLPGTPYNMQTSNCCKGGVLSSMIQDPSRYGAGFEMTVGMTPRYNSTELIMPEKFHLGLPGYSCSDPFMVPPSRFSDARGRRWTQALMTWNVTCSYSQFRASVSPTCCVSLSAFYNETIVRCPQCSCGCQQNGENCVKPGETPQILQLPHSDDEVSQPLVACSRHMCPIQVHWHVKVSYRGYWRVKITVTNLNFVKNYSEWSLVVQHPNLQSVVQAFSFNYQPLNQYGSVNDTGMFWGINHYNDLLLQSGENGNVQTEMLLRKDPGIFTFKEGWAFPRKIEFNGEECVMPPPDDYPRLPNVSSHHASSRHCVLSFLILLLTMIL